MKRALILGSALMLTACSGITTPPIDTPHASGKVTLSQMTNGSVPEGAAAPAIVPAVGGFQVQAPNGLPINVPSQAQSVNLSTAVLHIKLTNNMKIPLTMQLALSKTDTPYSDASASLTATPVTINPGQSTTIDKNVDTSLFKTPTLHLGVTFGTAGSNGLVTVSGSDAVNYDSWATVQVKLI